MDIHELARQNQQSAWKVLEDTRIIEAWERIGEPFVWWAHSVPGCWRKVGI